MLVPYYYPNTYLLLLSKNSSVKVDLEHVINWRSPPHVLRSKVEVLEEMSEHKMLVQTEHLAKPVELEMDCH